MVDPNIVNTIKFTVSANASDANGLDDIKRVFFRSYHIGLDSLMNNGNPILLIDDGSKKVQMVMAIFKKEMGHFHELFLYRKML
jgi:hypothetical protein